MNSLGLRVVNVNSSLEPPQAGGAHDTVDVSRLLGGLRRQRWTIVSAIALSIALGVTYLATTPKSFSAFSTLLLDADMNRSVELAGGLAAGVTPEDTVENARVVIRSDTIARRVATTLALGADERFTNPPESTLGSLLSRAREVIGGGIDAVEEQIAAVFGVTPAPGAPLADAGGASSDTAASVPPSPLADPLLSKTIETLQETVEVKRIGTSAAVLIRYDSHDPQLAASIASTYADAYVADLFAANAVTTRQAASWMQTRLDELRRQAQAAADEVERFRVENSLISSDEGLLTDRSLADLNTSLTAAISEAARVRAAVEGFDRVIARGVEGLMEGEGLGGVGGDVDDPAITAQFAKLNDTRARLDRLVASTGAENPRAAGLRDILRSDAERLFTLIRAQRDDASSAADLADARVEALRTSLDDAVRTSTEQGGAQVELRALERQAETLSELYQSMLARSQELDQQQSFPVSDVRVLSYAAVPVEPSGPRASRVLAIAIVLGLLIGLALAGLREMRDRTLRTPEDVLSASGLRFLGFLPKLPRTPRGPTPLPKPAQAEPRLRLAAPTDSEPQNLPERRRKVLPTIPVSIPALHFRESLYAETLRNIRLASEAAAQPGVTPTIGITSAAPDEARSQVALNLAGILALGNRKVLLIDADRRSRRLSAILGVDRTEGLSEALEGHVDWQDLQAQIQMTSVAVLPGGRSGATGDADDFVDRDRFATLLEEARSEYDAVVVDLAPLGPGAEGRATLRALDQFVIVGEWGRTPSSVLSAAHDSDPELMHRCIGVVLDRVNMRRLSAYLDPDTRAAIAMQARRSTPRAAARR